MSDDQLDKVRERFEREAYSFDAIYRKDAGLFYTWLNRTFRKPIFERYDITFQTVGDVTDKTVLDVGCGSGVYAVNFALLGARRVLGVDLSSQMIILACQRASEYRVEERCEFKQANFLEIGFPERFDISIAMGVFDYLFDPVAFLGKMKSVTNHQMIVSLPGHSPIREPLRKLRYKLFSKGKVYFYSLEDVERIVKQVDVSGYQIRPITTGSGLILITKL